jgi:hypothetical protein
MIALLKTDLMGDPFNYLFLKPCRAEISENVEIPAFFLRAGTIAVTSFCCI